MPKKIIHIFVVAAALILIAETFAADYMNTKYNWISRAADEQGSNRGGREQDYKFLGAHYLLLDFDLSGIMSFNQIGTVQLKFFFTDQSTVFSPFTGLFYAPIKSDGPWITGTSLQLSGTGPNGEACYLWQAIPSTPWVSGGSNGNFKDAFSGIILPPGDQEHDGTYIIFNLNKNVLQDFLEGNAHGIAFNGGNSEKVLPGVGLFTLTVTAASQISDIGNVSRSSFNVYVFPNPAVNKTSISFPQDRKVSVSIYSLSGEIVKNLNSSPGHSIWDGTDNSGFVVNNGIYIYKATSQQTIKSGKIVINR
ncbi:MAG: T9SS type A sorting domain-containing protein [bacterium]